MGQALAGAVRKREDRSDEEWKRRAKDDELGAQVRDTDLSGGVPV